MYSLPVAFCYSLMLVTVAQLTAVLQQAAAKSAVLDWYLLLLLL